MAAIALGGCNEQEIAQGMQTAQTVCSFAPTAATVGGIISALYPPAAVPVGVGVQVGQQICAAVTAKKSGRGGSAPPSVAGITIEGHFVHR